MTDVTAVEKNVAESFRDTVMEITGCNEEQADRLTTLVGVVVSETIELSFSDPLFMRNVFNNMLVTQVNANNKLANIEATISKAEWVVVDEEHETSDIRVKYVSEDVDSWIFERRSDEGWSVLEMSEDGRNRMVALAGKFFDQRTDRIGYIVDANVLDA